jgi:hypothetical protein
MTPGQHELLALIETRLQAIDQEIAELQQLCSDCPGGCRPGCAC